MSSQSTGQSLLQIVGTIVGYYYGGVSGAVAGFNISGSVPCSLDGNEPAQGHHSEMTGSNHESV